MHDGRHGTIKALAWTFGQHQRCHGDCSSFWTRHVFRCRVHWYQSSRAVFNDRWVQNFICLVFTTRSDNCLGRVSCKSEKNANSIASTQQQHRIKRCRRAHFFLTHYAKICVCSLAVLSLFFRAFHAFHVRFTKALPYEDDFDDDSLAKTLHIWLFMTTNSFSIPILMYCIM